MSNRSAMVGFQKIAELFYTELTGIAFSWKELWNIIGLTNQGLIF